MLTLITLHSVAVGLAETIAQLGGVRVSSFVKTGLKERGTAPASHPLAGLSPSADSPVQLAELWPG